MPIGIKKKFWDKTRKKWARNITRFNKRQAKAVRKRAEEFQRIAAKDIGRLSKRELLLVGTALYWAEGYKRNRWVLRFANSYPVMIKLIDKKLQEPLINAVVDKYIPSFVLLRIS